jgi:hypothetical protein
MLSSITPLGERGRNRNWLVTVSFFTTGAVLAGAFVFGLAGLLGEAVGLPGQLWWVGVGLIGIALIADLAGVRPPGPRRQVDENWLGQYRGWVIGLGYGLQLGSGFATIVPAFASWALLLMVAFTGAGSGLLAGIAFGIGRSLLILTGARIRNTNALAARMSLFNRWQRTAAWGAGLAQGVMLIMLVGAFA